LRLTELLTVVVLVIFTVSGVFRNELWPVGAYRNQAVAVAPLGLTVPKKSAAIEVTLLAPSVVTIGPAAIELNAAPAHAAKRQMSRTLAHCAPAREPQVAALGPSFEFISPVKPYPSGKHHSLALFADTTSRSLGLVLVTLSASRVDLNRKERKKHLKIRRRPGSLNRGHHEISTVSAVETFSRGFAFLASALPG
jgi:hypothetical protein